MISQSKRDLMIIDNACIFVMRSCRKKNYTNRNMQKKIRLIVRKNRTAPAITPLKNIVMIHFGDCSSYLLSL